MSLVASQNFTMPVSGTAYTTSQTLSSADEAIIRQFEQQLVLYTTYVPAAGSTVVPHSPQSFNDAGAPFMTLNIQAAGTTTIKAKELVGMRNDSTNAETGVTVTIYDAPTATGTPLEALSALGASQDVIYPPPGLPSNSGSLTLVVSGTPPTNGLQVLYRV